MRSVRCVLAAAGCVCVAMVVTAESASADVVMVHVMHHSFDVMSPVPGQGTPHATVQLGDTVMWMWMSDFHSVTSDAGLFDSGMHNSGFVFEHTFSDLGTFPYHCFVHGAPGGIGMAGSVTVVPGPGVGLLAVVGLGAAGVRRRRRR